jgi:hypothetical protein
MRIYNKNCYQDPGKIEGEFCTAGAAIPPPQTPTHPGWDDQRPLSSHSNLPDDDQVSPFLDMPFVSSTRVPCRVVDPVCFFTDPDPAFLLNLDRDTDPDPTLKLHFLSFKNCFNKSSLF